MKLKMIAAVLAIGLSAQANAAIDTGAQGNGELFVSIWNGTSSYTRDLNVSIDAFQSALGAAGNLNLAWAADANLTSFLAAAAGNLSALKFNVIAGDQTGARRIISTYTTAGATGSANDVMRTAAANIGQFATAVNTAAAGAESVVVSSASPAYAGKAAFGSKINNQTAFVTTGSYVDSNSFASGLKLLRVDALATGVAASINTQYVDSASAVKVWFDAANTLHIAAVPEPEAYAMFLAGLGMVGAIARRRRNLA